MATNISTGCCVLCSVGGVLPRILELVKASKISKVHAEYKRSHRWFKTRKTLTKLYLNVKNFRGTNKLVLPVATTTTYGLKSTCYIAAKAWNALPNNLRSVAEFARTVSGMS